MSLSDGDITLSPFGERHIPGHLWPSFSSVINPSLASFLPLHLFGSHWSKSHIATGNGTETSPSSSSSDTSSSSECSLSASPLLLSLSNLDFSNFSHNSSLFS